MPPGTRIRVAMVHGPGRPDHDGVSDYVDRLIMVLSGVDVDAVGVPVRPVGTGWLRATCRAADAVRRLGPDLVHVQFAPSAYRFSAAPGLLPLLLRPPLLLQPPLLLRLPLVTTVHEYGWWAAPDWVPDTLWRRLERAGWWDRETGRLVPASAAVVVSNAQHAAQVRARVGRCPAEVPIAPNVDEYPTGAGTRDTVRRRLGLAPDARLLAYFGFVHPVKGLRYAIEALPQLRESHPGLHLLVIGGFTSQALPAGEARAFRRELEDLTRRYGVADAVTFTGHLPAAEVSAALHAADAAVLPFTAGVTTKSGAALALLAHGLPTAATVADVPDPQLRDGETIAVISARRDAVAVARAVARLLDDAALRRRLADGGRRLADRYSWRRVAAAHRIVYETVLESRDE